jgi:long-chain acyl-CoA synthetase
MNIASLALDNIAKYGEHVAFIHEGRQILNTEQHRYSGRLAGMLLEHGIKPGDRVLVMMPNSPETLAVFYAAWKIGATVVPIASQLTAREAGFVMAHSGARVALTIPRLAGVLAEARVPQLLVFGPSPAAGATDIEPEVASAKPDEGIVEDVPEDLALLLYTSGTTARPKGVMLTHRNLLACCDSVTRLYPSVEPRPILQALPLHHVFGLLMFNAAVTWGVPSVILSAFDPVKAMHAIQDYQVSRMAVVPAMMIYLLHVPDRSRYDTSSLKWVLSGGGPLPEQVRKSFAAAFGCEVSQGYGLSETMAIASGYADGETYRPGSSGRPMPLMEIQIRDLNSGQPLPAGESGEITIRGPVVSPGYWNDPDGTREAFQDGWLRTGDIGFQDQDGYLYITDRKKDLIVKAGENISPREIEEVIHQHPAVAEASVIGIPDETYGENVCAFVVLKPGAQAVADDIASYAEQRLMKFKMPARIVFRPELPKNLAGKVLKRELRQQFAQSAIG